MGLLEDAADAANKDKGFPCAYRLLQLDDYYDQWDRLSAIPICSVTETIEERFLHFPVGTAREAIWRWFEEQHPNFLVGEVLQGIRRPDDGHLWQVVLVLKDRTKFVWEGSATGPRCAESSAIVAATEKTKQQVLVVRGVTIKRYFNAQ